MPRNRTARVAVLDRPVQRAAQPFPSRARSATKRRVVVGVLVVLSLALLSVYFREAPSGVLHEAQGVGATALRPFQIGAERVSRPFRDLYGYASGLVAAKEENEELRAQLEQLRQQAIENQTAAHENEQLRQALQFQDLPGLKDHRPVNTRVLSYPSSGRQLVIAAGSDSGITEHAPVLAGGALVGEVTQVTPKTSLVTLLNDESSAVSAYVVRSGAAGLVESGEGGTLSMTHVPKAKDVRVGDPVATSGSRVGRLPSLFPRGIPIGVVSSATNVDIDPEKRIQVTPHVDLSNVYAVTVLVR